MKTKQHKGATGPGHMMKGYYEVPASVLEDAEQAIT